MILLNRFNGLVLSMEKDMSPGERTAWLLRKTIKAYDRCVDANRMSVSFLTITQSDRSVAGGYRWITDVMRKMRQVLKRAGINFLYVAVLEIQPKRYKQYGLLAPHWHIVIATSQQGALPHGKRLENGHIQKVRDGSVITWSWLYANVKQKFGMYFICDAYSSRVYNYLGKYIAKGGDLDEFREAVGKRIKVFSHSRIPVEYQMSDGQAGEFYALISDVPEFDELFKRREGSRIVFRAKEIIEHQWDSGFVYRVIKYPLIHSIKSDWAVAQLVPVEEVVTQSSS